MERLAYRLMEFADRSPLPTGRASVSDLSLVSDEQLSMLAG
jgi:hypothetical protein